MGYSNTLECDLILAQALTSATPETSSTQKVKLINIGNTRDLNRIPDTTVNYYIELADSEIDGVLNQMYFTPFSKCAHGEWLLDEDLNPTGLTDSGGIDTSGNPISTPTKTIVVDSSCNLLPGDEILLHDDLTGLEEHQIIASIVDQNTFTTEDYIEGTFSVENNVRVIRIRFPPPLNQISARIAASFIYDKYFAAQANPNMSEYGKEMRKIADGQLNDILNGKTLIDCARRRGDFFGNPYLNSSYTHQKPYDGYNTSDRDKSNPK